MSFLCKWLNQNTTKTCSMRTILQRKPMLGIVLRITHVNDPSFSSMKSILQLAIKIHCVIWWHLSKLSCHSSSNFWAYSGKRTCWFIAKWGKESSHCMLCSLDLWLTLVFYFFVKLKGIYAFDLSNSYSLYMILFIFKKVNSRTWRS